MKARPGAKGMVRSVAPLAAAAWGACALAADADAGGDTVERLRRQVDEQSRQLEILRENLARQEAALAELRRALEVSEVRGRGAAPAATAATPAPATAPAAPAATAATPAPAPAPRPAQAVAQGGQGGGQAPQGGGGQGPQGGQPPQQPVGQAPTRQASRPPEVAPIFEQPGVLTPRGKWVFEPSLQYSYSSSNRVALVGYTVIPAILIGLIDVREVKRNTFTAALTMRRGITNRFEVEAKIPYVYRFDTSVSREVAEGSSVDTVFDADGHGIGDIEFAGRYQLNDGGMDRPYYIASLRFKTRTGKDPFEVETNRTLPGGRGTGLQTELPRGSGFYSLQPGLTVLFPTDPAVFFGGVSYQYSFKRNDVVRKTDGEPERLGEIQPGGAFGFNFGMGLALNERSSFSLGYDHLSVGKVKQNGRDAPTSVRVQLGTLLLGYSYRLDANRSINVSLGAGLTRDTPDLQLTVRMPINL